MFDKLQQLRELKKMRDEAMNMQRALDSEVVEIEKKGVHIKLTLAQRFIAIETNGRSEDDIVEAVNEAVKESQKAAAKKMTSMGGLDSLKGMFGGN
jgi:DNA-binding protein YbaB